MGRDLNPSCKKCRRNQVKLFLKGTRCETAKCAIQKRNYAPGKSGVGNVKKLSEYGKRLREKQKVKNIYGISERQITKYYKKADSSKEMTGHYLLSLCERRLDNVVARGKFARSRHEARQLVLHGHLLVNGKKVNIPSFIVKAGDIVSSKEKITPLIKKHQEHLKALIVPSWIEFNETENKLTILHLPKREEVDCPIQEQLVVEYYSR